MDNPSQDSPHHRKKVLVIDLTSDGRNIYPSLISSESQYMGANSMEEGIQKTRLENPTIVFIAAEVLDEKACDEIRELRQSYSGIIISWCLDVCSAEIILTAGSNFHFPAPPYTILDVVKHIRTLVI